MKPINIFILNALRIIFHLRFDNGAFAPVNRVFSFIFFSLLCLFGLPQRGLAVGEWIGDDKAIVRLIGPHISDEALYMGLEIRLAPGWKTYWRTPGIGGIAPEIFDNNSTNLVGSKLLFPAPRRYETSYGAYYGYETKVIFPLRLDIKDATNPIGLDFNFSFGVCSDVCVPRDVRFTYNLPKADGFFDPFLSNAITQVARPLKDDRQADVSLGMTDPDGNQVLLFDIHPDPELGTFEEIFIEPGSGRPFPDRERLNPTEGDFRYRIVLNKNWKDHLPDTIICTLTYRRSSGLSAYEQVIRTADLISLLQ